MFHRLLMRHGVVPAALLTILAGVLGCGEQTSTPVGPTATTSSVSSTGSAGSGSPGDSSGSGSSGSPGASAATGMVSVKLTDSPFGDAQAVLVTFSEVSLHRSGGDWEILPFAGGSTGRTCDLKRLQDPRTCLGSAPFRLGTTPRFV